MVGNNGYTRITSTQKQSGTISTPILIAVIAVVLIGSNLFTLSYAGRVNRNRKHQSTESQELLTQTRLLVDYNNRLKEQLKANGIEPVGMFDE